jgi:hypothetical protein
MQNANYKQIQMRIKSEKGELRLRFIGKADEK